MVDMMGPGLVSRKLIERVSFSSSAVISEKSLMQQDEKDIRKIECISL
jgi:hypothetical protein